MAKKRERKERRKSTARRRAEQHGTGFITTTLKMPENLNFWELKKRDTKTIDIIPYVVGKNNPFASEGELHYERTFYHYRNIGIEEKNYICSSKTFGKKDYIQEWRQKKSKDPSVDSQLLKDLAPKERQIFLIYDHEDKSKGIQLWEFSYHNFGKLLDSRVNKAPESRGWDLFYFTDDDGMSLELTFEESSGGGFKFPEVTAIDFVNREEPLPKEIIEHGICLDDLLVETPYEKLKQIFEMGDSEDEKKSDSNESPSEESEVIGTAEDCNLKKDDTVRYEGELYTIMRISGNGTSLILIDDNDDLVKDISPSEVELVLVYDNEPGEEKEEPATVKSEEEFDDGEWDE